MNKNAREGSTLRSLFEELGEWDPGLTLVTLSRASFALGLRPEIRFTPREVSRTPRKTP